MRVTDFHSHILPGIDDGSRDVEMSLEMLSRMKRSGVDAVVATPHFYGNRRSLAHFLERRQGAAEALERALAGTPDAFRNAEDGQPEKAAPAGRPFIMLGAEVALYTGLTRDNDISQLCIRGTKTLLLEMPFSTWTDLEINEVASICFEYGIDVVIAHLERYLDAQPAQMTDRLLSLPVHVQINAETLLPWSGRKRWIRMFESGGAKLLGSDSHNLTSRAPNLAEGREMLRRKGGEETLRRIDENAERLLAGAEIY